MSLNPFIRYTRVRSNSTSNVKISIFRIFPESYPKKIEYKSLSLYCDNSWLLRSQSTQSNQSFPTQMRATAHHFQPKKSHIFRPPPLNRQSSYSAVPNKRPPPLCFFTLLQYRRIYRLRLKWPKRRSSFAEWCLVTHFCSNKVKFWQ